MRRALGALRTRLLACGDVKTPLRDGAFQGAGGFAELAALRSLVALLATLDGLLKVELDVEPVGDELPGFLGALRDRARASADALAGLTRTRAEALAKVLAGASPEPKRIGDSQTSINAPRQRNWRRDYARRGPTLVLDLYGSEVARATGRPRTIPQGHWNSVLVYVPRSQRALVRRTQDFERIKRVRNRRIFPERLAAEAKNLVLTFRKSMADEIEAVNCLAGASAVWSMWPAYLDQPQGRELAGWFDERGIPVALLHSSGHADVSDLQRFAYAMSPREVTPVHTLHADQFGALFQNVRVRRNGERWSL